MRLKDEMNESPRGRDGEVARLRVPADLSARLTEAARVLRERSTPAEEALWRALRGRRHGGRKFRRQEPIGPFVVDFYCAEERLAVELDGGIHDNPQQARRDRERQDLIESLGIRVIRIPNAGVLNDLPTALKRISEVFSNESRFKPLSAKWERGGRRPG